MTFIRYPSIFNHDNTKELSTWLSYHPEMKDAEYVITEKIHGCNFSIFVSDEGDVSFCKRTSLLSSDEKFYDYQSVMAKYVNEIGVIKDYCVKNKVAVRVYGEMFGSSIQKGVDYGKEKKFLAFDVVVNNEWLSHNEMVNFLTSLEIVHIMVPVLGFASSLQEALDFNVNINTTLMSVDGENIAEGGVIKPLHKVLRNPDGSNFYIKKKNTAFKEKQREKKEYRDPSEDYSDEVVEWRDVFVSYLTDYRVQAVFSKHGRIESIRQLGDYIRLVMEDAKETFMAEEDFDEADFEKKDLRFIFNGGNIIVEILKTYL